MNLYVIKYIVRNRLIGVGQMPTFTHMGLPGCIPMPFVYVCEKCGDAWAKRTVLGGGSYRAVADGFCDQCGPGFLFRTYEPGAYIQYAPIDVVKRELQIISMLPSPLQYCDHERTLNRYRGNFR